MPPGRISTDKKKNKVLLIAIDEYQHQKNLQNAVRDVRAFKEVLIDKYGYSTTDFMECFNKGATLEGMFHMLRDLVKESQSGLDNVIIYFSGHGHFDTLLKQGSWVTHESDNLADNITSGAIVNTFIRHLNARHIFLIVDACFSGALFSSGMRGPEMVHLESLEKLNSRYALTSGRSDQEVPDGPPGGHSPFATAILEYLENEVTVACSVVDLIQYVKSTVPHNFIQQPLGGPLFNVQHKNGEMIFRLQAEVEDVSEGDIIVEEIDEMQMDEIEAFAFSLCRSTEDFERFLILFPDGKYSKQAELELMPMTADSVGFEGFPVGASADGGSAPEETESNKSEEKSSPKKGGVRKKEIDKMIETLMKENAPQLDEALVLSAHYQNVTNQYAQGILTSEDLTTKQAALASKMKKIQNEVDIDGLQ